MQINIDQKLQELMNEHRNLTLALARIEGQIKLLQELVYESAQMEAVEPIEIPEVRQ